MFKTLYRKLFKHDKRDRLETLLINLNDSIQHVTTDFENTVNNMDTLNELYEDKLHSEKLLKSVYDVSMSLFKNTDLETALLDTLKIITNRGCCQKTFIFKNSFTPNTNLSQRSFEWCDTSVEGVNEHSLPILDWDKYPNWKNKLSHDLFICGTKDNFDRRSKREILTAFDIESILVLPIFLNKRWWGSLILGTIFPKEWKQSEIDILLSICNIMGTAINRNELKLNSKICQNGSINFLRDIANNIDGVAFWMKDTRNRYVFVDKFLIDLIYPDRDLSEIIGRTDYQILLSDQITIDPVDFSKVNTPEDLEFLDLSEYNQVEICNITDQITQHFNTECNFFEKIGNKYLEVLKVPIFRQKTRRYDSDSDKVIPTGTAGALVDVTDKKSEKIEKLKDLIETNMAIRIGKTDNYYLRTKIFPVNSSILS